MKPSVQNIPEKAFTEAIASYNSNSMHDKSSFELMLGGLEVFKHLTGLNWGSLFLLDPNDFDFYYKTSTSWKDEDYIKEIYKLLGDNGAIANALSGLQISEWQLQSNNENPEYFLIIPLITQAGIIGLVILSFESALKNKEYLFTLCSIHSNHLAHLLNNSELLKEVENLKEVTEQQIALRTRDIVQSTRELKQILDSVNTAIIISDNSTDLIADANLMALELIGTTKDKLVGSPKKDFFFIHDKKEYLDKSKMRREGLLRKANGTLVPIIQTRSTIKLGNEEFSIESFIDISERKKMEEALEKAHFELEQRVEERTNELSMANKELQKEIHDRKKAEADILKLYWAIHQSPVAIIISDTNGTIEYANPQFTQMSGFKYEEVVGKNLKNIKSDDISDQKCQLIMSDTLDGIEWKGELRYRKKSGELFWISSSLSPIRNIDGDIKNFLLVQEDITEKKNAYEELLKAKELAEESNKLKSALLSNMTHEFRTPLIAILGYSQFLMMEHLEEELNTMAEDIYTSGIRLQNTLDGVLALSELEAIRVSMNLFLLDPAVLLESAIEKYRSAIKEKGLEFKIEKRCDGCRILVDTDQFRESIGYIIDNAIKYTFEGSICVIVDTEVKDEEKWVTISVLDTGIGIAVENQKTVFEAFRQASEGFSRSYQGCGLGLTISQKKIELMNGHITLKSEPGKGSNFTVWFPYADETNL